MMKIMILCSMLYMIAGRGIKKCITGDIAFNDIEVAFMPILFIVYGAMIYSCIEKHKAADNESKDAVFKMSTLVIVIVLSVIFFISGFFI